MNSRSSVNETNLVNFSAELSTLNQLETKDGLLTFPFDHIYACHSDTSDRRSTLQRDKEKEVGSHCVVGDSNNLQNPTEISRLQDQINSIENQNKKLKDLLIYHLDLIQQQNELITKRDKLYQTLKQENDTLKAKLMRNERRVAISPRTQALNAAYHVPSSTVTSSTVKTEPTTSQIILNSFSELLLSSRGGQMVLENNANKQENFKETFGIARLTADPEQIAAYTANPDLVTTNSLLKTTAVSTKKMIDNKRSLIKKEVRKEVKMKTEAARAESLYTATRDSAKPVAQRVQRSRRRTSSGVSRAKAPKIEIPETSTSRSKAESTKSYQRYTVNRKKSVNTYSKLRRTCTSVTSTTTITTTTTKTTTAQNRTFKFTGSLSDRLQLIDTTPTGEDPYQLGEADMREQSPIPKLMLNKTSHRKYDPNRSLFGSDKKTKVNRFMLAYTQAKEDPSQTMMVDEPVLDLVNTESDIDWRLYNKPASESICGFAYNESENMSTSLPSLDASEFQELFSSDVALDNLDNISTLDYPPDLTDRTTTTEARTLEILEGPTDVTKKGASRRGRKRAFSITGLIKHRRGAQRPGRGRASLPQSRKSPPPGIITHKPYHTGLGHPDLAWYLGLDPDIKLDDLDIVHTGQPETVEVPRWREKVYTSCYTLEGTENITEKIFEKRHSKLEAEERRQLRWHMRRIREQRHMERLRQRHRDSWSNSTVSKPSMYTVWPRPQRDVSDLHITYNIPVTAFGEVVPEMDNCSFMLPWVRTSKALKRANRAKTLH